MSECVHGVSLDRTCLECEKIPELPQPIQPRDLRERAVLAAESNARAQHLIAEAIAHLTYAVKERTELEELRFKAQMGRMTAAEERKAFG